MTTTFVFRGLISRRNTAHPTPAIPAMQTELPGGLQNRSTSGTDQKDAGIFQMPCWRQDRILQTPTYLLELTGRDSVPAIVRAQATMELNAAYGQQVIPLYNSSSATAVNWCAWLRTTVCCTSQQTEVWPCIRQDGKIPCWR